MLVLDHDRAGGYWGLCICSPRSKACRSLLMARLVARIARDVGAALYDAPPPHDFRSGHGPAEAELGQTGTEGALRRAHQMLDPKKPSAVVTGSIAEMIGGGVTPEDTNIQRFPPRTIDEDQWQSADRALMWLWDQFGKPKAKKRKAKQMTVSSGSTSLARPMDISTHPRISPRFSD